MATPNREKSDHVQFRTYRRPDGTKGVEVHTPQSVLPCKDRNELESQLAHYAKLLTSLHTADTVEARRKYVELIRPALRFYCRKFSREMPDWLKNDDYYTKTLTVAERQKKFGMKALRIGEFQQVKPIPNASAKLSEAHTGGDADASGQ